MADKSTDDAPKKKGKIGKILIFVVGGLSLVGVGLGKGGVVFDQGAVHLVGAHVQKAKDVFLIQAIGFLLG
jgi:hypothetical protein